MPVTDETRQLVDKLTAQHERLKAHRGRVIRYYDDAPDGSSKKRDAEMQLHALNERVALVEKQLDAATDQYIAEDEAPPAYTVAHTVDEDGRDRWFVEDQHADWVEGPYDAQEMAQAVAKALTAQQARSNG